MDLTSVGQGADSCFATAPAATQTASPRTDAASPPEAPGKNTSCAYATVLMLESTCWMCHFAGPCGDMTGELSVSWLLAVLGVCGFGGSICTATAALAMECGCRRASSAQCPDDVDCDSDVIFPCNLTTTYPDCFVLQRPAAHEEGMCTCYEACSTPPYSKVLPVDFTVGHGAYGTQLSCATPPLLNVPVLLALSVAALFTVLSIVGVGFGKPQRIRRLSTVAWVWPVLILGVFVYAAVGTTKSMAACSSSYKDEVVGAAFPRNVQCNNLPPLMTLLGCFSGLLCASYLPVLLRVRYLAASGKGLLLLAREGVTAQGLQGDSSSTTALLGPSGDATGGAGK